MIGRGAACLLWLCSAAASAAVVSTSPQGFEVSATVSIAAPPARVYEALGEIGRWWSDDHTWSGKAANLTLDLRAGGCFCERWDGHSIEHVRIVQAQPGLALTGHGGLGPMLDQGAAGALGWRLEAVDGGKATRLTQFYRVGGYLPFGPDKLAPLVDRVQSEQLDRLKVYVEASR